LAANKPLTWTPEPEPVPRAAEAVLEEPEEIELIPEEIEPILEEIEPILEEIRPILEEIRPVKEPGPGLPKSAAYSSVLRVESPAAAARAEAASQGGVLPLMVAAMAGVLVGAGLMGLIRQSEIDGLETRLAAVGRELEIRDQAQERLEGLKEELARVQDEIRLLEKSYYPAGSIPKTLTEAAILEYKTAEALLRQQAAALESGAGLTVTARGTSPDPELAAAVEEEMARLQGRVGALRLEAEGLAEEPWALIHTAIATEELNLAILNRNRLITRYGLSAPLPPRGPATAPAEAVAGESPPPVAGEGQPPKPFH
jgi:hypothetical protein